MSTEIDDLLVNVWDSWEKRPGCWLLGLGVALLFILAIALGLFVRAEYFT